MASNKNNVNKVDNNLFILSGDEEKSTPYDWDGMPEFEQPEDTDFDRLKITVRFRTEEDRIEFAKLIGQTAITDKTKSIWYPALERGANSLLRWMDEDADNE